MKICRYVLTISLVGKDNLTLREYSRPIGLYFDQSLPVSVRVGKAVDIVGKAGNPKSISGGYVHTTPTLLSSGERAELALDEYEALSSVLEGFVILREKSNVC